MIPYRFSARARRDAARIIGKIHVQSSPSKADEFEAELFAALEELSRLNGAGYRRPEITSRDLLFYKVPPYVLVFRRQRSVLVIVRVLHAASDLARYL